MCDSRSVVAAAQRAREKAERDAAPLHSASPARVSELRRLAQAYPDHGARVLAALRGDWTTAAEIERHLDSLVPHARLSAIRAAGLPLQARWVRVFDEQGRERRLMAYRLPDHDGVAA